MAEGNGNNGRASAGLMIAPAAVVLALLGTIGTIVADSFATDRAEQWAAIRSMSEGPNGLSALVERVQHVKTLAETNKARIEAVFLELDSKLQREMNLADATLSTELKNLDARLQSEIGNNARQLVSIDEELRRLNSTNWTKEDQREFTREAGFTLERLDAPAAFTLERGDPAQRPEGR